MRRARAWGLGAENKYRATENQMAKKMENEMESRFTRGCSIRIVAWASVGT